MIIDCFILFPFKGVPKSKRGEIWRFLAKQHKLQSPPGDQSWNEKSYDEIKEGLSTHQHSIFIDLGKCSRYFCVQDIFALSVQDIFALYPK